jgi:outer membrane protein assembly factor BamD (BamD/ComL family)
LAKQNRLLQSALVSERQGDTVAAERALRALLRDYPDSPFAPDAKRTLQRIAQRP